MNRVLIVSRTKMRNGVCVGGINLDNNDFVRLHTDHGANLPDNAPYKIGEIWNIQLNAPWNPRERPHVEDKMVMSSSRIESIPMYRLSSYIRSLPMPIPRGPLEDVFEGKLSFTSGGKGFINNNRIPSNSVSFWITDAEMKPKISFGKMVFKYKDKQIPYVGLQDVEVIPAETLIRLSLANWWVPEDGNVERRCYLQLSGWYI